MLLPSFLRYSRAVIALALQLLAASPTQPAAAPPPSAVHTMIAADASYMLLLTPGVSPAAWAFGISDHFTFGRGFEAALGLRVLVSGWFPARAAVEGYARIGFAPSLGPWRPSLSFELGPTAAHHVALGTRSVAPGNDLRQRADYGPFYLAFSAVPLRFSFSSFSFSVGAVAFGTDAAFPGRIFRVQLSLVELGWSLR